MSHTSIIVRHLTSAEVSLLRKLNILFADAFADPSTYLAQPPSEEYLENLLGKEHIVVLVALIGDLVLGGLVAYELDKLERARRELYIYDLAVDERHRRRGIATALIAHLREIAARRGAWIIFVQADKIDPPAIALYQKLGVSEEVIHFDIPVPE